MTENASQIPTRPANRRVGVVTRTLRPVQHRIGELQEAVAFIAAYAQRHPDDTERIGREIALRRENLEELSAQFKAALQELPEKSLRDTRLADARAAIDHLAGFLAEMASRCR